MRMCELQRGPSGLKTAEVSPHPQPLLPSLGGDKSPLRNQELKPNWGSFNQFLEDFLSTSPKYLSSTGRRGPDTERTLAVRDLHICSAFFCTLDPAPPFSACCFLPLPKCVPVLSLPQTTRGLLWSLQTEVPVDHTKSSPSTPDLYVHSPLGDFPHPVTSSSLSSSHRLPLSYPCPVPPPLYLFYPLSLGSKKD